MWQIEKNSDAILFLLGNTACFIAPNTPLKKTQTYKQFDAVLIHFNHFETFSIFLKAKKSHIDLLTFFFGYY